MDVDVIIPNYNQASSLVLVLNGFKNQITEHNTHIFVIDDGSTENIRDNLNIECTNKFLLEIIQNESNLGRAKSRNIASRFGKSELIIFNDGDRIPDSKFIDNHVNSYRAFAHIENVVIGNPKELYSQQIDMIWKIIKCKNHLARQTVFTKNILSIYNSEGISNSSLQWLSTFSGNMSIKRELFEQYYFDENFTRWGFENIDLGYRLFRDNIPFIFNQQAVNYHLAHKRNDNFYKEGIEWSIHYLGRKFKQQEEMSLLKDYMFGNISLQ